MPDTERDNLRRDEPDREPLVQYEDLEQATGFTQISNAVLRCYPELSDGEKMTYAVLKSFAYVSPETFVGEETLARARDVTVSTISRHLTRLVEVGLVKVRRRGQGKTNIWLIARIPRAKLEEYIREWRPNLRIGRNPQGKTTQNTQIKNRRDAQAKTAQDVQAEEEGVVQTERAKKRRSSRPNGPSSSRGKSSATAPSTETRDGADSSTRGGVENSQVHEDEFSTTGERVGTSAALIADRFGVPDEQKSIAGFIAKYDEEVVTQAFRTVITRLNHGDAIKNPIAYFYAVVKVMQAERDERASAQGSNDQRRVAIARNWARALLREWPLRQVRAILADTYRSPEFVDEVMGELEPDQ